MKRIVKIFIALLTLGILLFLGCQYRVYHGGYSTKHRHARPSSDNWMTK